MNALKRSWEFVKVSVKLLKTNTKFFLYPLFSAVFSFALTSVFYRRSVYAIVPGDSVLSTLYEFPVEELREWVREAGINAEMLALSLLFLLSFLTIFFNTTLVYSALDELRGESGSIFMEWRKAGAKIVPIFIWALIFGLTVKVFNYPRLGLDHVETIVGVVLAIAIYLSWVFWNLATYFIIPILIFEGIELKHCFKRSFQLLERTWKEQLIFRLVLVTFFEIGFWGTFFLMFKAFGFSFPDPNPLHRLTMELAVITFIALAGWFEVTFSAVLYSYAITGMSPKEFADYSVKDWKVKTT